MLCVAKACSKPKIVQVYIYILQTLLSKGREQSSYEKWRPSVTINTKVCPYLGKSHTHTHTHMRTHTHTYKQSQKHFRDIRRIFTSKYPTLPLFPGIVS